MPDAPHQESYDRGHTAGEISARLAGHDKHFASINGSLVDVTHELENLNLGVQKLFSQIESDRATAIALADALKAASHSAWAPWLRVFAVFSTVGVLFAIIVAVVQIWGK